MFSNLQEILLCHPFLMSQKFETKCCQWYGVKRMKSIFADKGIVEQDLGTPLLPHFFNKTLESRSFHGWKNLKTKYSWVKSDK